MLSFGFFLLVVFYIFKRRFGVPFGSFFLSPPGPPVYVPSPPPQNFKSAALGAAEHIAANVIKSSLATHDPADSATASVAATDSDDASALEKVEL